MSNYQEINKMLQDKLQKCFDTNLKIMIKKSVNIKVSTYLENIQVKRAINIFNIGSLTEGCRDSFS